MVEKYQKFFKFIVIPTSAILVYFTILFIYQKLNLPTPEEIISWTRNYYVEYGYWVVLIGALMEGLLFVNWYLPGSIVVALGVVLARGTELNIFLMLILVITGFFTTGLLNYAFGRFGWYHVFIKLGLNQPLEKVKSKVENKGLKILFTTYVHPNFGALAATSAGILRMDFKKFVLYSFISITLWNSFWTLLFYWFGSVLLDNMNMLIIAGGIFVYIMFNIGFGKDEKKTDTHLNLP